MAKAKSDKPQTAAPDQKTNVMRALDAAKIEYVPKYYDPDDEGDEAPNHAGNAIARQIEMPEEQVFKTLVARGDKTGPVVFCIPVSGGLNLKRAAVVSGNKRVELIMVKELLPLTGYIRGGCSPIGMKKKFPTYIDESALTFEKMTISAGIRGCQILISPEDLISYTGAKPVGDILA
nr:Cys-tRNA(Pro) deacylase [Clostridia bacterium]